MTPIACKCGRGNGEWVCRPLNNPKSLQFNAFADNSPKGFGLLQLDHEFNNYQDVIGWYNKRPSLWVEPVGDWGKGAVNLMEIPTTGETLDNIVCFWQPEKPVKSGDEFISATNCTGAERRRTAARWPMCWRPVPVWAGSRKAGRRVKTIRKCGRAVSPSTSSAVN